MSALRAAQLRYDNAEPEDDSDHQEALQNWIYDSAELLVRGCNVMIPQAYGGPVGVMQYAFVAAIADHLRSLQEAEQDNLTALAELLLQASVGAPVKSMVEGVVGTSDNCRGKLHEIAESLLEPFAGQGLEYQIQLANEP